MKRRDLIRTAALTAPALTLAAGCSSQSSRGGGTASQLRMWTHAGGNEEELPVIEQIVADFNAQSEVEIVLESFPQASYNDAIVAAATSGDLPDILDLDAPIMPNWAWAGYLAPLEIDQTVLDTMLPTTIGRFQDQVYSVGPYDTALALLGRRSALEAAGLRIPEVDSPWNREEFDEALAALSELPDYEFAIDLGVWDVAEWWPYAYAPLLQSFGGDLIDRSSFLTADGVLNGPEALEFGNWFQSVFTNGWASTTPTTGGTDFTQGIVPLVWAGGWQVLQAMDVHGADEVLVLPPPDFGAGSKTGAGSWQWGISSSSQNVEAASEFLSFLLQDEYLVAYSDAIGTFPTTPTAVEQTEHYQPDGALEPIYEISREYALVRPETPAYPVISSVFDRIMRDIMAGSDVQTSLDQAVADIDANIESNDGYGF
ncbi:MAG TPA: sugar ABC transporter substrate-binding protein [Candidatus Brachybacterium merdigallinarum]|nr:sugar ABC transporter substrate-binding protein [Candidatus Brachybacterium merdigallinarum]